jgi:hypothetical protein
MVTRLPAIRLIVVLAVVSQFTKAIAACSKALDLPHEQRVVKLIGDSQCEKYDFINDLAWYTSQKVSRVVHHLCSRLIGFLTFLCLSDGSRRNTNPL